MLHLVGTLAKYCGLIISIRLAATLFNWEFGVSRQYLRLLELVFQVGERRIEKVKSRERLNQRQNGLVLKPDRPSSLELWSSSSSSSSEEGEDDFKGEFETKISSSATDERGAGGNLKHYNSNNTTIDKTKQTGRQDAFPNGTTQDANLDRYCCPKQTGAIIDGWPQTGRKRTRKLATATPPVAQRRISTPDGPPVFLLDLDELDHHHHHHKNEPHNHNQTNFQPLAEIEGEQNNLLGQHEFQLTDACLLVAKGISAIMDDQVTKRFSREELRTWNLLTRNDLRNYHLMSRLLALCWIMGLIVRYSILLPVRIIFALLGGLWLIGSMFLVGLLPHNRFRMCLYRLVSLMAFRMLSCALSSRLRFYNRQFRPRSGDICVANHTSPLDVLLLACDNCYALVGQLHGGLLGLLERALSRAANHVWFDREEMRDRQLVTERLRSHLSAPNSLPVLVFPEGTCINNSAVMMFRKGSFETSDRVCPVAMKYDSRFGDPFWNSSEHSYAAYLLLLMCSWAIKCDVWYLPPMERLPKESAAEFANRVKAEIARQGGLVDLAWDGQLKRHAAKELWRHQQQQDYASLLKLE